MPLIDWQLKQGTGPMATTPNNKKQIMDVAKPGKTTPDATTRPIIVNHGEMIKDPMVNTGSEVSGASGEHDVPDKAPTPRVAKSIQPLSLSSPESKPRESEDSDTDEKASAEVDADAAKAEDVTIGDKPTSEDEEKPPVPTESSIDSDTKDIEPPGDDSDDAAVVDAVADRAAQGKKQKEEDKETLARREVVNKLVVEKKYFVPIKPPARTRNGRMLAGIVIALLVLLAGGYAAVDAQLLKPGFDVPFHFLRKNTLSISDAAKTATDLPAATAPITGSSQPTIGTINYASKDYGVGFSYPAAWGQVAVKKENGSIKGTALTFAFSQQPLLRAGMLSRDYKENGRDGACFVLLGIMPELTITTLKSGVMEGDGVSNNASYKTTTQIQKSTTDTFVYEHFEAGTSEGLGGCSGLSDVGYKAFTGGNYTGIQFVWANTASQKIVPIADFSKYKAKPTDYLSDSNRKDFLTLVESAKVQ
jgi:hypothetical protein